MPQREYRDNPHRNADDLRFDANVDYLLAKEWLESAHAKRNGIIYYYRRRNGLNDTPSLFFAQDALRYAVVTNECNGEIRTFTYHYQTGRSDERLLLHTVPNRQEYDLVGMYDPLNEEFQSFTDPEQAQKLVEAKERAKADALVLAEPNLTA